MRPLRLIFLSLALALATVPAFAAQALAFAGQDATVVFQAGTVTSDGQIAEKAVPCPAGSVAIGGGAQTDATFPVTLVLASNPLEADGSTADTNDFDIPRWWYTAVTNATAADATYDFYAICSASSDATVQVTDREEPGATGGHPSLEGEAVGCPPGQRVIGGGLGTTDNPLERGSNGLTSSQPLDSTGLDANTNSGDVATSWYSAVKQESTSVHHYRHFAVCSSTSRATVRANPFTTDTFEGRSALCPSGSRGLGGGLGINGQSDAYIQETAPTDSLGNIATVGGGAARGWFASADATVFPAASRNLKAFAMCEPSTTGRRAAALKKCKKKHTARSRRKCRHRAKRLPV